MPPCRFNSLPLVTSLLNSFLRCGSITDAGVCLNAVLNAVFLNKLAQYWIAVSVMPFFAMSSIACLMIACLTANDGNGGKIDVMSKWAENYLIYQLDTGLARRIFRSANEAGMELSLNDWAGQNCINELRTTAQGIVNAAAAAGVCEPTEVLAEDYWTWKEANPIDYAAKRYTGLSVYANLRIGLREVVFKLIVSFA